MRSTPALVRALLVLRFRRFLAEVSPARVRLARPTPLQLWPQPLAAVHSQP